MPHSIKVPHPFKPGKHYASAFVVEHVEYPIQSFSPPSVEWFYKKEHRWRQGFVLRRATATRRAITLSYPPQGEFLIRPGGTHPMRDVSAVLKLRWPYLAYAGIDDD